MSRRAVLRHHRGTVGRFPHGHSANVHGYLEIENPHAGNGAMWISLYRRLIGVTTCWLFRSDAFAHADDPVDLPSFVHEQASTRDIPVHDARGLDLGPLAGHHSAPDLAADDRFPSDDVAFDFPALHHAVRRDVAHDPHAGADD